MMKPFLPVLRNRAGGTLAMIAEMNRIENAARLAMADLGGELLAGDAPPGTSFAAKLGLIFASLAVAGLVAANLL